MRCDVFFNFRSGYLRQTAESETEVKSEREAEEGEAEEESGTGIQYSRRRRRRKGGASELGYGNYSTACPLSSSERQDLAPGTTQSESSEIT